MAKPQPTDLLKTLLNTLVLVTGGIGSAINLFKGKRHSSLHRHYCRGDCSCLIVAEIRERKVPRGESEQHPAWFEPLLHESRTQALSVRCETCPQPMVPAKPDSHCCRMDLMDEPRIQLARVVE